MKIKINQPEVEVIINMKREELLLICSGLGETSTNSRINAGMTSEQANACGEFYQTLYRAIHLPVNL